MSFYGSILYLEVKKTVNNRKLTFPEIPALHFKFDVFLLLLK